MPVRKFEYSDSKSHKFWNIEQEGKKITTTYGRIGTDGQSKTKELADKAAAEKEFEKLIKQKTSKGYVEAGDEGSGGSAGRRREFHFVSGASAKFWAIELKGTSFDVNYGKIGTAGQTKTKEFDSEEKALAAAEKLIGEKTSKGYEETSGGAEADSDGVLKSMMFSTTKDANFSHLKTFIGHRVIEFKGPKSIKKDDQVYAIRMTWEEEEVSFADHLNAFLETDGPANTVGLVIGSWSLDGPEESSKVVQALCDNKDKFPKLIAIFLGDIEQEENEVSWIEHSDLTPLLSAFPNLEMLRVRGATGLQFKNAKHEKLRAFAVESGGLGREIVLQICKAKFPKLEHLELWLGTENYGGDCRANDLQPILAGKAFSNLKYLGLRNSEIVDDIAGAVVSSPLLKQLETLDLSLGTLTDEGGNALLGLEVDGSLKRLDVHHHFMSSSVATKVKGLSLTVNASDRQEPEDWGEGEFRFVAIGE